MKTLFGAFAAAALAATTLTAVHSAPARAHHSFSGVYDSSKPFKLTGTVVRYALTNPHARILMRVKKTDGTLSDFTVEMHSASTMLRKGMSRTILKAGDRIVVEGSMARRNANQGFAQTVQLPNGKKIMVNEGLPDR